MSFQVIFLLSTPPVDFLSFLSAGNPKGVMLTHGNVVADFSGFLKVTDVSDKCYGPLKSSRFWDDFMTWSDFVQ